MPSVRCRWWGHAIDPVASHYYSLTYCARCDCPVYECPGVRERIRIRWFLVRTWIHAEAYRLRDWVTCSDCGHHWGRHDETVDHLPF